MLKSKLAFLSLMVCFVAQVQAGDAIDITADEDKMVTKYSTVKFIRHVGQIKYKVKVGADFLGRIQLQLKAYKSSKQLIDRALYLKTSIVESLGFSTEYLDPLPSTRKNLEKKTATEISSARIKKIILNTPLEDLLKDDEKSSLYYAISGAHNKIHECEYLTFSRYNADNESKRRDNGQVEARLGLAYSLYDHLVDLDTFFLLPDPNAIRISLVQGTHCNIDLLLTKDRLTGAYDTRFQIHFDGGALKTFSFHSGHLQDAQLRHILDTSDMHDETMSFNVWAYFMSQKMQDLIGAETHNVLVKTLTEQAHFKTEANGHVFPRADYKGITPNTTLEKFCNLVNLTTGVNKLAHWAVN